MTENDKGDHDVSVPLGYPFTLFLLLCSSLLSCSLILVF